jgi:hypothetical protein
MVLTFDVLAVSIYRRWVAKKVDRQAEGSNREKSPGRKQVTVYLPTEQWRALKVYAAQHDQEMSQIVSDALTRFGITKP